MKKSLVVSRSTHFGTSEPISALLQNARLVMTFARREIEARYRSSVGGLIWAIATPLLLLAIYTAVFGVILQARWAGTGSTAEFALVLYSGLLIFNFFQDCLIKAPSSISSNANLVQKVVFPVELLAWTNVLIASFHLCIGLFIWMIFQAAIQREIQLTILALPLVLTPLVLLCLGIGWLLGAVGVFVRDLDQFMPTVALGMMFLSPIFFSLTSVPDDFRILFLLNPLTILIEQARDVMLERSWPDLPTVGTASLAAYAFAWFSLWFFRRARPEFADAL